MANEEVVLRGSYPEIDYSGYRSHHETSWLDHIIRNLESAERRNIWHSVRMTGIMDFTPPHDDKSKDYERRIRARLPDVGVLVTNTKVYWTVDKDARARLMKALLAERAKLLHELEGIEGALNII